MIAVHKELQSNKSDWQTDFVSMLPEIKNWLRLAFRKLGPEAREDALEEGIVHTLVSYASLHARGCPERATASSLAWYAARAVKRGRPAVGRMNGNEPLSRYAQLGSKVRFKRQDGQWIETLVADNRASIPDLVAAKIDVRTWFGTLTKRMKGIAKDLAVGSSTSEVARIHGLSAGRISQVRRILEESWMTFQQEATRG